MILLFLITFAARMENNNSKIITRKPRLTIRITQGGMSFSAADPDTENQIVYENYVVKSGISQAANLREAFRNNDLLASGWTRALMMVDTPVVMIPVEMFSEDLKDTYYHHAITGHESDLVMHTVIPSLNAVALYSFNKDLKTVADDHFDDVKFTHVCVPVWNHLHRRSFTGNRQKLFGYFHDKQLDICAFQQNRMKFQNSYAASHALDAVYFLLYVWKQLGLDQRRDELHLMGTLPDREKMTGELKKYLKNVFVNNPAGEYNRAPITQIKGIPYDLITHYLK